MRNLLRLLNFGRSSVPAETLPVISMDDGERAIQELRASARIDIDRYLEAIEPATLMKARVGPSSDCLTVDDVAAYANSTVGFGELASHLAGCSDCRETVRLYKAVQEDRLGDIPKMGNVLFTGLETLQIAPSETEFSFVLETPQAIVFDALQLSAQGVFDRIDCRDLVMIRDDASAGYAYRARCVAHTSTDLLRSIESAGEICGWISVSGRTKGGQLFSASDLLCGRLKV